MGILHAPNALQITREYAQILHANARTKGRTLSHPPIAPIRVPPQPRRRPGELAVAQMAERPAVVRAAGGSIPPWQIVFGWIVLLPGGCGPWWVQAKWTAAEGFRRAEYRPLGTWGSSAGVQANLVDAKASG